MPTIITVSLVIGTIGVLIILFWVFAQLLNIMPGGQRKPRDRKKASQPAKASARKTKSHLSETIDQIKSQYPNAIRIDAKTIVEEYNSGKRDFLNVFPAADAPYETFFKWTNLDEANFSRAILYRAPFDGTSLVKVNFNGAYLESASFRNANLQNTDFSWADLRKADFQNADLTGANLSYAVVADANFSNAILTGAIISKEQLDQASSVKGAKLPDVSKDA